MTKVAKKGPRGARGTPGWPDWHEVIVTLSLHGTPGVPQAPRGVPRGVPENDPFLVIFWPGYGRPLGGHLAIPTVKPRGMAKRGPRGPRKWSKNWSKKAPLRGATRGGVPRNYPKKVVFWWFLWFFIFTQFQTGALGAFFWTRSSKFGPEAR